MFHFFMSSNNGLLSLLIIIILSAFPNSFWLFSWLHESRQRNWGHLSSSFHYWVSMVHSYSFLPLFCSTFTNFHHLPMNLIGIFVAIWLLCLFYKLLTFDYSPPVVSLFLVWSVAICKLWMFHRGSNCTAIIVILGNMCLHLDMDLSVSWFVLVTLRGHIRQFVHWPTGVYVKLVALWWLLQWLQPKTWWMSIRRLIDVQCISIVWGWLSCIL